MRNKKITPLIEERAKQFQDLFEKGCSIAEAAVKMGISKDTIYDEAHLYAEINGVPSREKPSRFFYIKDYKSRAKSEIELTPKSKTPETETPEPIAESADEESTIQIGAIKSNALTSSFDDVIDKCEYLIGLMTSKIEEYKQRVDNLKEETV